MSPSESSVAIERFVKICKATRWNVRTALDLIFIHAEKEVRGRQPRASLNPLTVLSAAAAYERFFNDLYAAAKDKEGEEWRLGHSEREIDKVFVKDYLPEFGETPELRKVKTSRHWLPEALNTLLHEAEVVDDLTSYWSAWMSDSWFGATPTDWAFRKYSEDPGAFNWALQDVRQARDGAAHFVLPKAADRSKVGYEPISISGLFATKLRDRGKEEWTYGWDSDAESDTVQSGLARGVTAFIIQLIDSSIVAAADRGGWSAEKLRLPAGWFAAEVPGSDSRYAGAQFWGDQALHRVRQTRPV